MDGFETTRAIRNGTAGSAERDIPIVAMTAHAVSGFRERCLEAGMNDYVSKPVNFSTLPETIAKVLGGKKQP
jgi:CheY-like chemotaxis protein